MPAVGLRAVGGVECVGGLGVSVCFCELAVGLGAVGGVECVGGLEVSVCFVDEQAKDYSGKPDPAAGRTVNRRTAEGR
ncbi:MAG: hypothetical protein LBQ31_06730 [Bacteroidales bacterium]|nr:hypothetical protein [Bacteroidales bacterium]